MFERARRPVLGLTVLVAAVVLGGCGEQPAGQASAAATVTVTATVTAGPSGTVASAMAPTQPKRPLSQADTRACDAAHTTMLEMAAATAKWSPQTDPFSPVMSTQIRSFSEDLGDAGRQAAAGLRSDVQANATALKALADAMAGSDKAKVFDAIGETQIAYGELKRFCSFE